MFIIIIKCIIIAIEVDIKPEPAIPTTDRMQGLEQVLAPIIRLIAEIMDVIETIARHLCTNHQLQQSPIPQEDP